GHVKIQSSCAPTCGSGQSPRRLRDSVFCGRLALKRFRYFALMPAIAHIANLWTLVGHPSPAREWTLERKIRAIAAAGFDGITAAVTPEHRRLAERHGLRHILGFV